MLQKRYNLIAIILIIIVSTGVYINTFKNEFVYDDIKLIVENPEIRNLSNIFKLKLAERPMRTISLMLDYKLFKLNPAGYHLTNLILHILCSILVYFFIAGLTSHFPLPTSHIPLPTSHFPLPTFHFPLLTSLLFAVHPIQTEAVACISNRKEMLCMLFFMLSIILYIKTRDQKHKTKDLHLTTHIRLRRTQLTTLFYYLGSIVCFILALLSKQVAWTLPFLIIAYDFYFSHTKQRNQLSTLNSKLLYLPYFVIIGVGILLGRQEIVGTFTAVVKIGIPYQRFLFTLPLATIKYLGLFILPYNLCADYHFSFSKSLFEPQVLASIIILGFLIWIIVKIFKISRLLSFSILWIFINLLPVSNIVPGAYLIAERYMYISSLGFCCVVSWLLSKMKVEKIRITILAFILLTYSILTVKRNSEWRSGYTLWSKTVIQNPRSSVAHYNLGNAYRKRGLFNNAINEYKQAIKVDPNYAEAYTNLGIAYGQKRLFKEAFSSFKKAISLDKMDKQAYYNLGNLYSIQGLYEDAVIQYLKAVEIDPSFKEAYNNLGSAFFKLGRYQEAINVYKKAIGIDPNYKSAIQNLRTVSKKIQ